jgi:hypothetical protein
VIVVFNVGCNGLMSNIQDGVTWDESKLFGCVCDSSWTVGLESGETQQAEWFGPDCSLRKLLVASIFHWDASVGPRLT